MSVRIMSAVFDSETLGPTERLIMLALADHADDEGKCYPSIARLCRRTGLKERAVQNNIRSLSDQGYLTIVAGGGRNNCNLYIVSPKPRIICTPHNMHPASDDAETPHLTTENPALDAPKPSRTTKEPPEDMTERKPVKARIPENWHPGDEGIAYAVNKNIPMEVIRDEIDGFRAYWFDRTDAQGRKSQEGWKQCWQNRVRAIAVRYSGKQRSGNSSTRSAVHSSDRQIAFAARAIRTPDANCI